MDDPDTASLVVAMEHLDPTSLPEGMDLPVTASLGPMGPLLRKLHPIGPEDESRPLKVLCISLKNMSEHEAASLSNRWWMKLVRELLYDAEDHLDEVDLEVYPKEVAEDFSELLSRAEDASKRLKHLDLGESSCSRLTSEISDEQPIPLAGRSTVGSMPMEPPEKLVGLLALDDDDDKALKVIPIHGCAGVGKTTVARTLYDKHGGKYQCRAFVSVSRNPDMRGFLTSILSQLKVPRPRVFPDVQKIINSINKHLEGKRYFIVVDDLWTSSVWNIISRAFPPGDHCSRIITTTHLDDVALACCSYDSDYIYKMEPLNYHDSRNLFFGIVFGSEDSCPTYIKEVSYKIISKCGGLPLAIVNIASLLASEPNIRTEKWMHIQDYLSSNSDGMKDIVKLIYNSVPPVLRTFLLYLSMYPQGSVIWKDELVKVWVAEGFLSAMGERDTEETAETYFDELVTRRMVQVVNTNNNGEVLSCTVHHMVLDFIRYISMEENFIINVDYFQSHLALPDKVRRLSVQFGGVKGAYIPENIITSQVRSLMFWGFFKCVPPISDYGLLRVLILHIWADRDNKSSDLTMIGKLFLLDYLKIECNITVQLPDKIQSLQNLGTLHVDATLSAVPSDIVHLQRLLHLRLPTECFLTHGVAIITSLRSLGYFDLNSASKENMLHLGQLTNLQHLQLTCFTVQPPEETLKRNVQLLASILEKLRLLQSVTLVPALGFSGDASIIIPYDGFSMVSPPSDILLRRIELSRRCCIFFTLPQWLGELRKLCILKIAIRHWFKEDVDVLKVLPSLTALTLYIQTAPADEILIGKGGFQALTYFKFICAEPRLSFEEGAMPKVQKVNLGFNAKRRRSHTFGTVGFRHLAGLIEIFVKLGARDDEKFDIQAAQSALEVAVKYHSNNLIVCNVQRVGVIFDGGVDQSSMSELRDIAQKKFLLEVQQGKKKTVEGPIEEKEGTALEMQNEITIAVNNKKNTELGEQHVNKNVYSRYARTERYFTPLPHHPGTMRKFKEHIFAKSLAKHHHLSNLYSYTKEQVGIKVSRNEVISRMIDGREDELKIFSIVGIGGVGKTTLAKSVYDRIQMQFDCRAFVSVSSEPVKNVLVEILLQIDRKKYMSLRGATLDTMQLIGVIQGLLANKRYLIIVDDILDVDSWELINRVLVHNRLGSRVVTTTRSSVIAEKAGGVYMLNPLSREDSEELFNTRLFCGKEEFPSGLMEGSRRILHKCGGVPLAIIAVASLLARKERNVWHNVENAIFGDKMNMSTILAYSIYTLPYYLRACLLYLHTFPVGYLIKKENLIWKWAAEGLIVQEKETGLFELGEAYFKELVNRNLVMPVEDDSHCSLIIGFRIHRLVLDEICALSNEENFVMVQDGNMQKPSSGSGAWRLAVQRWAVEHEDPLTDCDPERLRSFNAMECHFSTQLPSLSRFKVLRVVSIEECTFFEGSKPSNLKHLGKLLLLRYLGLYKTPIDMLPEEIGDLIYLQTLDLRETTVKTLPERVGQLRQLKCLRADEGTTVPHWIGNLTSLEELRLGEVGKSVNFVNELGNLRELRELHIWAEDLDENKGEALVRSMNNLQKMQVLRIMGVSSSGDEPNWEFYKPPGQLREFHMTNPFSRLPRWINASRVPMLSYLHVQVKAVEEKDLENLGSLPELVCLKLLTRSDLTIKGDGAFPRLRNFGTSTLVRFLPAAMPCLEFFGFKVNRGMRVEEMEIVLDHAHCNFHTLENLPLLQKVEVEIVSDGLDVRAVHAALKHGVDKHPNSPNLDVITTDRSG